MCLSRGEGRSKKQHLLKLNSVCTALTAPRQRETEERVSIIGDIAVEVINFA